MKKVTENLNLKRLRELAERDPELLEVLEGVKAAKDLTVKDDEGQPRLRMPYVNSQPLTDGSWK